MSLKNVEMFLFQNFREEKLSVMIVAHYIHMKGQHSSKKLSILIVKIWGRRNLAQQEVSLLNCVLLRI